MVLGGRKRGLRRGYRLRVSETLKTSNPKLGEPKSNSGEEGFLETKMLCDQPALVEQQQSHSESSWISEFFGRTVVAACYTLWTERNRFYEPGYREETKKIDN